MTTLKAALAAATLLVLTILAGFVWFAHIATAPAPPPAPADGIVVLTGGSNRIETGLNLLAAAQAPRLLISGVLPGTDWHRLARAAGIAPATLAGRVTLGCSAISTRGNAEETADWAARHDLKTLIVVTAFYHMPRALAELHRALPNVALHPVPVRPDSPRNGGTRRRLLLLASEYLKFLAVHLDWRLHGADRRPGQGLT